MENLYHGSKIHKLKVLEPKKSTHGNYVYATKNKIYALIFSGRCGDDLTYCLKHFESDGNNVIQLVENIPNALNVMFSNDSSIYRVSNKTFKDINSHFDEVVSSEPVKVLNEEYIDNVYLSLLEYEKNGLLKIYRYPNRPKKIDNTYEIIDKWRYYKYELNKDFEKYEFDRLFYLHPDLLNEINKLLKEFNYNYFYSKEDLINIFKKRVDMQLYDMKHEQYINSAYISICNTYPDLKNKIDKIYDYYNHIIDNKM